MYIPAPGIFNEVIHMYLARDLEVGASRRMPMRNWSCKWMPLGEAIGRVLKGEWNDGKTALGLLRAQYQLQL